MSNPRNEADIIGDLAEKAADISEEIKVLIESIGDPDEALQVAADDAAYLARDLRAAARGYQ